MLCLKRKVNQRTFIIHPDGTRTTVIVARVEGDGIVLGFEADPSVHIVREEAINREPRHAKTA